MSSQEKDSLLGGAEVREVGQGTLEQVPSAEVQVEPDGGSSADQATSRHSRNSVSSAGRRLARGARKARQGLTERSQQGWSQRETVSHYLGQARQLLQRPQNDLHEDKALFDRLKTKFQARMSEWR